MAKEKKNTKNNILLIVIIIIALIMIGGGVFVLSKKDSGSKEKLFYEFKDDETKVVDICKKEGCGVPSQDKFVFLKVKDNYSDIFNNSIKEINEETEKYYNEVKNSPACSNDVDKFYHSKFVDVQFENYENNYYVSITPIYTITDLCEMKATRPAIKTHIYDKTDQKLLTQEEFIKKIGVSEEEIQQAIKENNELIKEEEKIEIMDQTFDDYLLFLVSDGSVNVAYSIEGNDMYYTATVK